MSETTFPEDNSRGKYLNYFKALYNRNKWLILISTVILFASVLIGYIYANAIDQLMNEFLGVMKGKFSKEGINTLSILLNNLQSALFIYVGGVIGIITAAILFINGLLIGYVIAIFPLAPLYIIPHGIFEIPALILAGAAGFRITSMIFHMIKSLIKDKPVSDHFWEFKDSLVIFGISALLFLVAAIIEANFTLGLGNYLRSFI